MTTREQSLHLLGERHAEFLGTSFWHLAEQFRQGGRTHMADYTRSVATELLNHATDLRDELERLDDLAEEDGNEGELVTDPVAYMAAIVDEDAHSVGSPDSSSRPDARTAGSGRESVPDRPDALPEGSPEVDEFSDHGDNE